MSITQSPTHRPSPITRNITSTPTRVLTFADNDRYGSREYAHHGFRLSSRQVRKLNKGARFIHSPKNGIHDPLTYYHLMDALLRVKPDEHFSARMLMPLLKEDYPQLRWDVRTVGRILNDIMDNLEDVRPNGAPPVIGSSRRWDGNYYFTTSHPVGRAMMQQLIEDLYHVAEQYTEDPDAFDPDSPLLKCPSVMPLMDREEG